MEACICKALCHLRQFCLILIADGNQHGAAHGQLCLCCLLCLEEGFAVEFGKPKHLACGAHFGSQNRVNLLEHIEGEYGFLHAVVRNILFLQQIGNVIRNAKLHRRDEDEVDIFVAHECVDQGMHGTAELQVSAKTDGKASDRSL